MPRAGAVGFADDQIIGLVFGRDPIGTPGEDGCSYPQGVRTAPCALDPADTIHSTLGAGAEPEADSSPEATADAPRSEFLRSIARRDTIMSPEDMLAWQRTMVTECVPSPAACPPEHPQNVSKKEEILVFNFRIQTNKSTHCT